MSKDLGKSTSYAYYVDAGGTKTPQEYGEMLVNIDTVATRAEDAADAAAESATGALNSKNAAQTAATTATNKASEATTAATTATNKAAEAQADADAAALDASQAMSAASTATTKATEATTAAATAVSAKDDAVSANTAAQSAKTAAQTAQTGAETAAASVQSSAAQIATNAEDISQLKSDLANYEKYFVGLENPFDSASWIGNYYIAADGTIASHTNFKYSSLIQIDYNVAYTFVWNSIDSATIRVHGYDVNGDWVEQVATFSSGSSGITSKILVNASSSVKFIRFSMLKSTKEIALYSGKTIEENLKNVIETVGQVSISLSDLINSGSYIASDGTIVDTSLAFARSNMIPAFNLSSVFVVRSPRISGGFAVAFYSDNEFSADSFISGYEKNSVTTNTVVPVPSGTKYIAFSARTNEGSFSVELGFEKMIEVIQNNASKVDEIFNYPHKGEKLSILGDSISTYLGYCPPANAMFYPASWFSGVDNTWWKRLLTATKMDLLINNSSSGSHMATNDSLSGLSRCENLDDGTNEPDHIIVYMGINDFANGNGVIGECGLNPETYSVNNFSDAYYTALHNIKTKYPNARLYLGTIMQYAQDVTFPNKRHNVYLTAFNDAIHKLADIFGAKVIDFTKCGIDYFNQSTTLGDTLHPNVIGHNLMFEEAYKHFK